MKTSIKAVIAEDDPSDAARLCEFLDRYSKEHGTVFSVRVYSDAVSLSEKYEPGSDIIFMDIEMPDVSGMEASRRVRVFDKDVRSRCGNDACDVRRTICVVGAPPCDTQRACRSRTRIQRVPHVPSAPKQRKESVAG